MLTLHTCKHRNDSRPTQSPPWAVPPPCAAVLHTSLLTATGVAASVSLCKARAVLLLHPGPGPPCCSSHAAFDLLLFVLSNETGAEKRRVLLMHDDDVTAFEML